MSTEAKASLIELKTQLREALMKARDLTQSTCATYVSLLSALYTAMKASGGPEFFSDHADEVVEFINKSSKSDATKKTQCSGLFVLTKKQPYNICMREGMKRVTEQYAEHKPTNDTSFAEIRAIHERLEAAYKKNPSDLNRNNLLISSLTTGVYNPPRRLTDWSELKLKGFTKGQDNYVQAGKFYLNVYKTQKNDRIAGTLPVIDVPKPVLTLVNRIKKLYPDQEYLLTNEKGEKFTSNSLNKRLTTLFGVSCNKLRSIYLTDVVYADAGITKLENTAALMGNTVQSQIQFYVKKK